MSQRRVGDRYEGVAKVLLVEDSAGDASLVMAALGEPVGRFGVQWVPSLEAAIAKLAESDYECILVDLGLPDGDGLEVVDTLRRAAGDAAIVVLTARNDEALALQSIQHGADDYLFKAESPNRQLHRCIDYAVERARSRVYLERVSSEATAVVAVLGDGLIVISSDGTVLSANPAAGRIVGIANDDLVGRSIKNAPWSFVHRDLTPVSDDERPALVTLSTGEPIYGEVTGVRSATGELSWVELNTYPMRTTEGQVHGVVVSVRDIGERLAAEEANRFQAAMLAAAAQGVIVTDPQGLVVFWNPSAEDLYGWSASEAMNRPIAELVPAVSASKASEFWRTVLAGSCWSGDFPVRRRDGTVVPLLASGTPVLDHKGELKSIICMTTDITERKQAEEKARSLSAIVESSADAIFTVSCEGVILTWNRGAQDLYGYEAAQAIGRNAAFLYPEGLEEDFHAHMAAVSSGATIQGLEAVRRRRDGSTVPVSVTGSPIYDEDGNLVAISSIGRDMTDRRQLEAELARQALHDTLTGLPNRTLLDDRLSQALASCARRDAPVAVLFIDLDQFKTINDANGHIVGDKLLVEVARRLHSVVRPADTVARFGGDEFVMVCESTGVDDAEQVANRVAAVMSEPIEVNEKRHYISASIGIAVTPPLEPAPDALLRFADTAMYDAKAHGRARWRVFDASLATKSTERLELTNDLREALFQDSLQVHYQPVVELATGRLVGLEALTRWQHPIRGWVPPDLFVPLAEENGLISILDRWVLARACAEVAELRASGVLPLDALLAVNISARNVTDPDLVDAVRQSAAAASLPLESLELEVTETGFMEDAPGARAVLGALRQLGVGVALDDFGTGYSSLTYVRQLPVTTIKIDQTFTRNITERQDDLAIVASVLDLARAVGLRTVAEGVETHEQLALLRRLGCSNGQGFLWSKALPSDEFLALLMAGSGSFLAAPEHSKSRLAARRGGGEITNRQGLGRIMQLHMEGASFATIATALNAEGFRTTSGHRWRPGRVERAIADLEYHTEAPTQNTKSPVG